MGVVNGSRTKAPSSFRGAMQVNPNGSISEDLDSMDVPGEERLNDKKPPKSSDCHFKFPDNLSNCSTTTGDWSSSSNNSGIDSMHSNDSSNVTRTVTTMFEDRMFYEHIEDIARYLDNVTSGDRNYDLKIRNSFNIVKADFHKMKEEQNKKEDELLASLRELREEQLEAEENEEKQISEVGGKKKQLISNDSRRCMIKFASAMVSGGVGILITAALSGATLGAAAPFAIVISTMISVLVRVMMEKFLTKKFIVVADVVVSEKKDHDNDDDDEDNNNDQKSLTSGTKNNNNNYTITNMRNSLTSHLPNMPKVPNMMTQTTKKLKEYDITASTITQEAFNQSGGKVAHHAAKFLLDAPPAVKEFCNGEVVQKLGRFKEINVEKYMTVTGKLLKDITGVVSELTTSL
jgi:hypothetical protein